MMPPVKSPKTPETTSRYNLRSYKQQTPNVQNEENTNGVDVEQARRSRSTQDDSYAQNTNEQNSRSGSSTNSNKSVQPEEDAVHEPSKDKEPEPVSITQNHPKSPDPGLVTTSSSNDNSESPSSGTQTPSVSEIIQPYIAAFEAELRRRNIPDSPLFLSRTPDVPVLEANQRNNSNKSNDPGRKRSRGRSRTRKPITSRRQTRPRSHSHRRHTKQAARDHLTINSFTSPPELPSILELLIGVILFLCILRFIVWGIPRIIETGVNFQKRRKY